MNELSVIGSLCCLERDLRLSREKGKNKEIKENFKRLSWVYCATNTVTISGIATEQTLQVARRKYTVKGYLGYLGLGNIKKCYNSYFEATGD